MANVSEVARELITDRDGHIIQQQVVGVKRISPNSGKKSYIPDVSISLKPNVGMVFQSIDKAFDFYEEYANKSGFSVRRSTQNESHGIIRIKYLVCSKEGYRPTRPLDLVDTTQIRKEKKLRHRPTKRTGCKACVVLKSDDGKMFKVDKFVEGHNHSLVSQDDMHLLPSCRKLSYEQMGLLCSMSKHNIGPVRAFNIMRTKYGGFENVGATADDCKNFKKKLNLRIGEYDADMLIDMLNQKKKTQLKFSFEYTQDANGQLTGLFWADEQSKNNYDMFGDVISFDATYRTNKYKMVFIPFTGIDNHCCNVTFGAALVATESIESYKWVLQKFTEAFGKAPKVVVTDQDAAMKQAIESVWPHSRHRLCMWHIMTKVADKVGTTLCNDDVFKSRICNIVWTDSISPDEFDKEWLSIMEDYGLINHVWFIHMFEIRHMWIPVFYRDEPMSGLTRTTSRSESENHYFGQVSNVQLTLMEFFTHFDTAMQSQRHRHRKNDHRSRYTKGDIWSNCQLEVQAEKIYTRSVFFDVQEEIYDSIHYCMSSMTYQEGDYNIFVIKDKKASGSGFLQVSYRQQEDDVTVTFSCKRFEQYGLLCKHCFYVLRYCEVDVFPSKYILRRWCKDVVTNVTSDSIIPPHVLGGVSSEVNSVVRDIMVSNEYIVNKLVNDMDKLSLFRDQMKELVKKTDEETADKPNDKQKDIVSSFIPSHDDDVSVHVPSGIRNKGCGSHKRYKSTKEQAISRMGKRSRSCHNCGQSGHDRRTCPALNSKKDNHVVDE